MREANGIGTARMHKTNATKIYNGGAQRPRSSEHPEQTSSTLLPPQRILLHFLSLQFDQTVELVGDL